MIHDPLCNLRESSSFILVSFLPFPFPPFLMKDED